MQKTEPNGRTYDASKTRALQDLKYSIMFSLVTGTARKVEPATKRVVPARNVNSPTLAPPVGMIRRHKRAVPRETANGSPTSSRYHLHCSPLSKRRCIS